MAQGDEKGARQDVRHTPSARRLKMYGSIWKSKLREPMWTLAANIF